MDRVSVFLLLTTALNIEVDFRRCSALLGIGLVDESGLGLFLTVTFTNICWLFLIVFCIL